MNLNKYLRKSKRPLIIAGGGIRLSDSVDIFRQFIEKAKIPVVSTVMALDALPHDSLYYVGHGGTKGQRCANKAIMKADLIISMGSRLAVPFIGHNYQGWAPNAKKVVIDIDEAEHKKPTLKIDLFIKSDLKKYLNRIIKYKYKPNYQWIKECQCLRVKPTFKHLNIYSLVDRICDIAPDNAVFMSTAGATFFATCQSLKLKKDQRAIMPGATSTMGFEPAVIGVWFAEHRPIILITGDGSFQMNLQELQVLVHHKIPVKIFVINNGGYLAIRTTQKLFFNKRLIGEGKDSGISFPSLKKIAEAYGMRYKLIDYIDQLGKLKFNFNVKQPTIIEVITPHWEDIISVGSKRIDGKLVSMPYDEMYPYDKD